MDTVILANLIKNAEYGKKVISFLKDEYFHSDEHRIVFTLVSNYVKKYTEFPSKEALFIDLSNRTDMNEELYKRTQAVISSLATDPDTKLDWLIDKTEKFCQEKAIHNGIREAILILDDKSGKTSPGMIPKLLQDALAVSFDNSVGHDFLDDYEKRFELYHKVENKIPFDIDLLNTITKGGVSKKTLNLFMAGCVHPETKVRIRYRKI